MVFMVGRINPNSLRGFLWAVIFLKKPLKIIQNYFLFFFFPSTCWHITLNLWLISLAEYVQYFKCHRIYYQTIPKGGLYRSARYSVCCCNQGRPNNGFNRTTDYEPNSSTHGRPSKQTESSETRVTSKKSLASRCSWRKFYAAFQVSMYWI